MSSREDARKAVLDIAKKYNFLDEAIVKKMDEWPQEQRRLIEEGMMAQDKPTADAIKTLSANLYSSDARFVFELLRNADDRRFDRVAERKELPSIEFHIRPDRIDVVCNDDGFTTKDLSSICAVGKRAKSTSSSPGSVAAKDIGFQSVFMVASEVHIRSGHFSFSFKHRKGDSGLGIVMPVWVDAGGEGPAYMQSTRISLHLHKGDEKDLEHLHRTISKQFDDLQETCLLFLRKLRRIWVMTYDRSGWQTSNKCFTRNEKADSHQVTLRSCIWASGSKTTTNTTYFHITRHEAASLARNQSRELLVTDDVVLAFPLSERNEPVLERQNIMHDFLPVEESPFKFIVQSDFDTAADGGIVATSQRNIDLLGDIAGAFIKTILNFCDHQELCYTWPQFLPQDADKPNEFWSGLNAKIKRLLHVTPVLRSRHLTSLRRIGDVYILTDEAQNAAGQPLLDFPARDPYLSGAYPAASRALLVQYGLQDLTPWVTMEFLESDLESSSSQMKATSTSQSWHSAAARLLLRWLLRWRHDEIQYIRLRQIALIPLADGTWVSANSGVVYLPTTLEGKRIPPGLGLRVIDPSAAENSRRRVLFKQLGAEQVPDIVVWQRLRDLYSQPGRAPAVVTDSKAHLHFLFLCHKQANHFKTLCQPSLTGSFNFQNVYVCLRDGKKAYPYIQDVYFPGDQAYGPDALFQSEDGAPAPPVGFLHSAYLDDAPVLPKSQLPTWRQWLVKQFRIRNRLRIVCRYNPTSLSEGFRHVARHRPGKLFGLLKSGWEEEGERIQESRELTAALIDLDATKLCGLNRVSKLTLVSTWLPLPSLQQLRLRFMKESDAFPFLNLESCPEEDMAARWEFLQTFGVRTTADDHIEFLQDVLFWMTENPRDETFPRKVLDLYVTIEVKLGLLPPAERHLAAEQIRHGLRQRIRSVGLALRPRHDEKEVDGGESPKALWDGPSGMTTAVPFKAFYTQMCEGDAKKLRLVTRFFQQTLEVHDACLEDIVTELENLREAGCDDLSHISGLYRYLSQINDAANEPDEHIRSSFLSKPLIFVPGPQGHGWYKSGECGWSRWSGDAEGRAEAILEDHYADMEHFFLKVLRIKAFAVLAVYEKLQRTEPHTPVERVKEAIESLNSLLRVLPRAPSPTPLLQIAFLPVRYPDGSIALKSADEDFAIVDRDYLGELFRGRIKLLGYSFEDVRRLAPFFQWAGLKHRYLFRSTKAITSASSESARPISNATRKFGSKAHAILRIAATFDSPRYKSDKCWLYQLLRSVQVLETDKISTLYSVSQDGSRTQVETSDGVHIEETSAGLRIFVPANKLEQEICFHWDLPLSLARWLMHDSTKTVQDSITGDLVLPLASVLQAPADQAVVNAILDRSGIVQVPLVRGTETDDEAEAGSGSRAEEQESAKDSTLGPEADEKATTQPLVLPRGGQSASDEFSATTAVDDSLALVLLGKRPSHAV